MSNKKTLVVTSGFGIRLTKFFLMNSKGFEFKVGDKDVTFNPGNASELKKNQTDIMNFINKFMGDDGLIQDAAGYHKALSVAMNPSKFAQFFYEQGKADGVEKHQS